ncbi:MAG: hypothetical protein JW810_04780, partial [Sedimentisphaerales bacterium]|nr:hypothetical protein [Sedimentisphaerales bacterium]
MKKKIILLSLSLMTALGGLLLYQRFTRIEPAGPDSDNTAAIPLLRESPNQLGPDQILEAQGVGLGNTEDLVYVRTDKNGRVIRKFGFAERLESAAGRLKVRAPWVQIFTKDDRIVEITADRGTVDLDDSAGQIQIPQSGQLEQVRVRMYSLPPEIITIPIPLQPQRQPWATEEMIVTLAGQVNFQLEFSRLESSENFTVQSAQFQAEGDGLMLEYDQNREQLRELQLLHIEQLRIHRRIFGQPADETAADETTVEESTDAASTAQLATYQFTLSDRVRIDQPTRRQTLLADFVQVLVDVDYAQFKSDAAPLAATGDSPRSRSAPRRSRWSLSTGKSDTVETNDSQPDGQTSPKATTGSAAAAAGAVAAKTAESEPDIILQCDGPLYIRQLDTPPPARQADRLIFWARGKPAQIWENDSPIVYADQIHYDQSRQQGRLLAGPQTPVRMMLAEQQWATAGRQVILDEPNSLAILLGPGQVEAKDPDGDQPARIHYSDRIQVKFSLAPQITAAAGGESKPTYIEWISFTGPLQAQSASGRIQAQEKGKLLFYAPPPAALVPPADKVRTGKVLTGPVQGIELAGKVSAQTPDSLFRADDRLEAQFARLDPNRSVLQYLAAYGPVYAEDPNFIIEAAEKVQLDFATDTDQADQQAPPAMNQSESAGGWGFDQILQGNRLQHVTAVGQANRLRFLSKQQHVEIVGDRAEGYPQNQTWTISGRPARVVGLDQDNRIEGNQITADLQNNLFRIAGAGTMDARLRADLLGGSLEPGSTLPVHLEWLDGVTYHLREGTVIAEKVNARLESTDQTRQLTVLQCPKVTIELDPNSAPAGTDNLYASRDLKTFLAHGGPVQLQQQEHDLQDQRLLRERRMLSQRLYYDNRRGILAADGPGRIEATNYESRPA